MVIFQLQPLVEYFARFLLHSIEVSFYFWAIGSFLSLRTNLSWFGHFPLCKWPTGQEFQSRVFSWVTLHLALSSVFGLAFELRFIDHWWSFRTFCWFLPRYIVCIDRWWCRSFWWVIRLIRRGCLNFFIWVIEVISFQLLWRNRWQCPDTCFRFLQVLTFLKQINIFNTFIVTLNLKNMSAEKITVITKLAFFFEFWITILYFINVP